MIFCAADPIKGSHCQLQLLRFQTHDHRVKTIIYFDNVDKLLKTKFTFITITLPAPYDIAEQVRAILDRSTQIYKSGMEGKI